MISSNESQDTRLSPKLISQCNNMHLNLTMNPKSCVQLSLSLGNTSASAHWLVLYTLLTLHKSWNKEQVLWGLDNVKVYLDNIGIFSKTWEEHLLLLEKILSCPEASGFAIKHLKCEWGKEGINWLAVGYPQPGLSHWRNKKCSSIVTTKEMIIFFIKWYHTILAHPVHKQSQMTIIQARYYDPNIRQNINHFDCIYCQHVKFPFKRLWLLY